MNRSAIILFLFCSSQIVFINCQSTSKSDKPEKIEIEEPENVGKSLTKSSTPKFSSEPEVKEYLNDQGFMISMNGKEVIREDQLTGADPSDLAASISILGEDKEKNKMTLFYLKVAGAALENNADSEKFINEEILDDEDYLEQVDRMTKFLQRQDRPTIKKALLGTIAQMSDEQCIAYLQKIGYVSGSSSSGFSYEPNNLKVLPIFVKIAIADKFRTADGDGSLIYDQLEIDLGLAS